MKALQATKHKTHLANILIDFYKEGSIGSLLGFKGGTASMLFYDLPRFSTDLDFNLLSQEIDYEANIEKADKHIDKLLMSKYNVKDHIIKRNTLFWVVSYGDGLANIKVEISTRSTIKSNYEVKTLYGVDMNTMVIGDMVAHKLVAAMERTSIANRDLFDIHYFLSSQYVTEINSQIIVDRTGLSLNEFYSSLLEFVSKLEGKNILSGLGEVLTPSQKDWAKAKLIPELKELINRQIDLISN